MAKHEFATDNAQSDNLAPAQQEPLTRFVSCELPNLGNPIVAAEYHRQRAIINTAAASQREEIEFWEACQVHDGWA